MKKLFIFIAFPIFFYCQSSNKGAKTNDLVYCQGKVIRTSCEPFVYISKGDTLIIELIQYPGRAYTWYIDEMDTVHHQLKYIGLKTFSTVDLDGAPEKNEYIFLATDKDSLQLNFKYQRPWERDKPAIDSCNITVVIKS